MIGATGYFGPFDEWEPSVPCEECGSLGREQRGRTVFCESCAETYDSCVIGTVMDLLADYIAWQEVF